MHRRYWLLAMFRNPLWAGAFLALVVQGVALGGAVTQYEYNAAGDVTLTWITDIVGVTLSRTETEYDQSGKQTQVVRVSAPDNSITTNYTYDVAGNLITQAVETDTGSSQVVYQYDVRGRRVTVKGPSTAPDGLQSPQIRYGYDLNGNVVTVSTRISGTIYADSVTEYDAINRVTKTVDALGNVRRTVHDSTGKAVAEYMYDSVGVTLEQSRMSYDSLGHVITRVQMRVPGSTSDFSLASDAVVFYSYDIAGRLTGQTTYDSGIAQRPLVGQLAFDALGRLTKRSDPKGYQNLLEYDSRGFVTAEIRNDGTVRRTETDYDDRGRVISTIDAGLYTTVYGYDPVGRQTTVHNPKGDYAQYWYDMLDRKTKVVENAGDSVNARTTEYAYSKQGLLVTQTAYGVGDGEQTVYVFNPEGRVATLRYPNSESANDDVFFEYYPGGAVSRRTDQSGNVLQYTYDNRGLLLTKSGGGELVTYAYDGLGRMITAGTPETKTTCEYDGVSNVVLEVQKLTATGDARTVRYEYDQSGRRTKLVYPQ